MSFFLREMRWDVRTARAVESGRDCKGLPTNIGGGFIAAPDVCKPIL